jgi:hypothetical protein
MINVAEGAAATGGISYLVFELLPLTLKKGQDKNAAARGR